MTKYLKQRHDIGIGAIILSVFVILILIHPAISNASQFIKRDGNIISRTELIDDDVYFFGNFIEVYGIIEGDLSGFCYNFETSGEVNGNANVFAYQAYVNGKITKSVRIFAYKGEILGNVGANVVALGNELLIGSKAVIARDLTFGGEIINIDGNIKGDIDIGANVVKISGIIEGNVNIKGNDIIIEPTAVIRGNLDYVSTLEADISPDAVIEGKVSWEEKKPGTDKGDGDFVLNVLGKTILFLMALVTGFGLILFFRSHTKEASNMIEKRFWFTLAIGVLSYIILLIGSVLLLVLIVSIPLAVIVISLGVFLFYVGKVYVSVVIGRLVFKLLSPHKEHALGWELVIGLILLTIVFQIPGLGMAVYILAFIIGTGGAIMGYISNRQKLRAVSTSPPQ